MCLVSGSSRVCLVSGSSRVCPVSGSSLCVWYQAGSDLSVCQVSVIVHVSVIRHEGDRPPSPAESVGSQASDVSGMLPGPHGVRTFWPDKLRIVKPIEGKTS